MIEIIEFLQRLTKKVPDFASKESIRLDMGSKISPMILVRVTNNGIIYKFQGEEYTHPWNPRSATLFRWGVRRVEKLPSARRQPTVSGSIGRIVVTIDKMFNDKGWKV